MSDWPQRDDRHDVGDADPRVRALVPAQVDPLARHLDRRDERLDERPVLADDREHRAVVVDVRVHVEQPRVRRERVADRVDRRPVAALGEVRHGLERQHGRTVGRVTRRRTTLPLARLARARPRAAAAPASRPAIRSSRCRCSRRCAGQRAYLFGQAPGIQEGVERRPWRGRAGQTLRRWLELDEDAFYATFYCASVTRCYPGPRGVGPRRPHADARGAAALRVLARARAALLRPRLIVTVGGLAARTLLGLRSVTECVGTPLSSSTDGAVAIPLPHPSGASSWLNLPENRARVAEAAALVRAELRRLDLGA